VVLCTADAQPATDAVVCRRLHSHAPACLPVGTWGTAASTPACRYRCRLPHSAGAVRLPFCVQLQLFLPLLLPAVPVFLHAWFRLRLPSTTAGRATGPFWNTYATLLPPLERAAVSAGATAGFSRFAAACLRCILPLTWILPRRTTCRCLRCRFAHHSAEYLLTQTPACWVSRTLTAANVFSAPVSLTHCVYHACCRSILWWNTV